MHAQSPPNKLLLIVCGLVLITAYALGRPSSRPHAEAADHEYKVVEDVTADMAQDLDEEGWEYVGYLGRGIKGQASDETLWRRPQDG